MCMGGKPKAVKVAQAPEEQDAAVVAARDDERKRRIASASSTVLTGPQGLTSPATTAPKTLLGS